MSVDFRKSMSLFCQKTTDYSSLFSHKNKGLGGMKIYRAPAQLPHITVPFNFLWIFLTRDISVFRTV